MPPEPDRRDPESTAVLLDRARAGDGVALDALFVRCLPPLRRWARGRLPPWARAMWDTQDLVQETVVGVLRRLDVFESRGAGALQAYLRQAVLNRIRDEVRRARRHPAPAGLDDELQDPALSPLEKAIGRQALDRYEAALQRLRPEHREAIVARLELDYSYREVADALGKPTADAARMAVMRALERLATEMGRGD